MKKLLKLFLILVLIAVICAATFYTYISIDGIPKYPELVKDPGITIQGDSLMIANGERLASMLCVECHMNRVTNILSGEHMPDAAAFGNIYSANITQDRENGIGNWTDGQLIYFLRTGVKPNGNYAPPYMPKFAHMSDDDLYNVIAWLHSDDPRVKATTTPTIKPEPNFLAKFLSHVAFKPLPYPDKKIVAPDTADHVAYGKYVVQGKIECFACHSASFKTMNILEPEKSEGYMAGGNPIPDADGKIIFSANLTPDEETGIGNWTEAQFINALKYGLRPDATVNRYPMVPYTRMTDYEAKCVYAYLKTLAPVKNPIARNF